MFYYEELEAKLKEGGKKVMFLRCIYGQLAM